MSGAATPLALEPRGGVSGAATPPALGDRGGASGAACARGHAAPALSRRPPGHLERIAVR